MKESEFIELLNLYLDHEISAADAVRLEAEVQANPARRKVYEQYCRMQKACRLLTADFATDAAETAASGERKIIAFNPAVAAANAAHRRRANTLLTVGSLAAAACVAVIVVNRADRDRSGPAAQSETIVQTAPAKLEPVAATEPARRASQAAGPWSLGNPRKTMQPQLVSEQLSLTASTQPEAVLAKATNEANDQLKWVASLQVPPLQQQVPADVLRFDVKPATLRPEARLLGGRSAETEAEMTVLRFVK